MLLIRKEALYILKWRWILHPAEGTKFPVMPVIASTTQIAIATQKALQYKDRMQRIKSIRAVELLSAASKGNRGEAFRLCLHIFLHSSKEIAIIMGSQSNEQGAKKYVRTFKME